MGKIKEKLWESKELIIAIFLVLLLLITGSYAWYKYNLSSDQVHIIKAGNLKLVLDDSMSEGIMISNAIPVSDRKGLETKVYTFTLENLGSVDTDYTLYFDDLALGEQEKRMRDDYVKYSLVKNDGSPTTALLSTIGENPNRILETGTIAGKTKNRYTLQVWINKDAKNDVMGTIFYGKIRIVAESKGGSQTPTINEHIEKVVSYDPTNCTTGEEATCVETTCHESKAAGSCPPGTIIKYAVNDETSKYFYVLHDDGETLTLQQSENTVSQVKWTLSSDNSQGPSMALMALESTVSAWTNVNRLHYKLGETTFLTNPNNGCDKNLSCEQNSYPVMERDAYARMITVQEATALGCSLNGGTCPRYLISNLSGGAGYWTSSARSDYVYASWVVNSSAAITNVNSNYAGDNPIVGARAVVEINK